MNENNETDTEWNDAEKWAKAPMSPIYLILIMYGAPLLLFHPLNGWIYLVGGVACLMAIYCLYIHRRAIRILKNRNEKCHHGTIH
jgi:hypothetical protein